MSEVTVGKNLSSRIIAAFPYDVPLPSQVTTAIASPSHFILSKARNLVNDSNLKGYLLYLTEERQSASGEVHTADSELRIWV